jgi:hypothetical protein
MIMVIAPHRATKAAAVAAKEGGKPEGDAAVNPEPVGADNVVA